MGSRKTTQEMGSENINQENFHCPNCCDNAIKPKGLTWDKVKDNLNKVIIPLFMPLALLFFTYWQNRIAENKRTSDIEAANKKAASDKEIAKHSGQLEMEIKVLSIIWPDLTSSDPTKTKNALDLSNSFLKKIYVEKSDSLSPLLISVSVIAKNLKATSSNKDLVRQATNYEMNVTKIDDLEKTKGSIVPIQNKDNKYEVTNYVPVIEQKTQIAASLRDVNLKSLPKIFIQYSDLGNKEAVDNISQLLSNSYIVPPIDHVSNTVGYGNEIRYYNEKDVELAKEIQDKLYKITGTSFILKNINYSNSISNTIEVWYNNEKPTKTSSFVLGNPDYEIIANYTDLWFKPKYALNFKENNLSLALLDLNKVNQSARIELDSYDNSFKKQVITLTKDDPKNEFSSGKYKYVIKFNTISKAGKNFLMPNAAYIDVIILKRK